MKRITLFAFLITLMALSAMAQVDTLELTTLSHIVEPNGDTIMKCYFSDIFGDSAQELVVSNWHCIRVYNSLTGELLRTTPDFIRNRDLVFEDLNSDGHRDVAFIDTDGVKIYDLFNSQLIWSSPNLPFSKGCFALGDLYSDGFPDIVVVRRELFRNDRADDSMWVEIYNGPAYSFTSRSLLRVAGYESNDGSGFSRVEENPSGAIIAELTGGGELYPTLIIITDVSSIATWFDPWYWYSSLVTGSTFTISSCLGQWVSNGLGKYVSHSIIQSDSGCYLYFISQTNEQLGGDLMPRQFTTYKYSVKYSALGRVDATTFHFSSGPDALFRDWVPPVVGNINPNQPGDEICYGLGTINGRDVDSIMLKSYPAFEPIWSVAAPVIGDKLYLFHSNSLFNSPQILRTNPMVLISGVDGSLSAVFSGQDISPTYVLDLNNDGDDEIVSVVGSNTYVYSVNSYHVSVDDEPGAIPSKYRLHSNYPNPFNAYTIIRYDLPKQADVTLEVYDILGRKIATLANENQQAGSHQVTWDGSAVSSGVYFYRIEAGSFSESKRMLLVK